MSSGSRDQQRQDPGLLSGPRREPRSGGQPAWVEVDEEGFKGRRMMRCGQLHNESGPASEFNELFLEPGKYGLSSQLGVTGRASTDGTGYFVRGLLHRDDGPALTAEDAYLKLPDGVIFTLGHVELWARDGQPHRDDGPALVSEAGGLKLPCGAAIEPPAQLWIRDGKIQRDDGAPLVIESGERAITFAGELQLDGPAEIWLEGGEIHREDGPAVVAARAYLAYFNDIERVVYADYDFLLENVEGWKLWFQHDQLHREDGPAIESDDGLVQIYVRNGKIHREGDAPAVVIEERDEPRRFEAYYRDGLPHRDGDQPAVSKTTKAGIYSHDWYRHGRRHRENGPAVVYVDNPSEDSETWTYFLDGEEQPWPDED